MLACAIARVGIPSRDLLSTAISWKVEIERVGRPCTYIGAPTKEVPTDVCLPAAYIKSGSQAEAVMRPLTINGEGSAGIKFYGALADVNRALAALSYKTVPYFNRLYRPPKAEQSLDYDPAIDKVDTLSVVADDLGNSGGMQRDVQVQILVDVFC